MDAPAPPPTAEQIPSGDEALRQAVLEAQALLRQGGHVTAAYPFLLQAVRQHEEQATAGPSETTFVAHRMLGQCARMTRNFAAARAEYHLAFRIAHALGVPDRISAALEGLALTEAADDDPRAATELFERAVEFARMDGPGLGLALVLQNYGHFLHNQKEDRAAEVLREALAQPGLEPYARAIITDHLGMELARQGDAAAAVARCGEAAAEFERIGADYDAYKALMNLSTVGRSHDREAAVAAWVRGHDLIHRIAREQINVDHYGPRFAERVREIEEASHTLFRSSEDELPGWLRIGLLAKVGGDKTAEGEMLVLTQRYDEAERALRMAESMYVELQAHHLLPRVWGSLGLVYMVSGRLEQAWTMLQRSRAQAHALGHARAEANALTNLASLLSRHGMRSEIGELEYIAQARALRPLAHAAERTEPVAVPSDDIGYLDAGVLDSIAFGLCRDVGAHELAEKYLRRSVAVVQPAEADDSAAGWTSDEDDPDLRAGAIHALRTSYARRLGRLAVYLAERDPAHAELPDLIARLEALLAEPGNPALTLSVEHSLSAIGLIRGERTAETLTHLIATCAAHEALRSAAADALGPDGLQDIAHPQYRDAVSIALELGRTEEAFALLERSKGRLLLDAVRRFAADDSTDAAVAEEASLWRRVRELRSAVRQLPDQVPATAARERARMLIELTEELQPLEERLRVLWGELAHTRPAFLAQRRADPIGVAEVRDLLDDQPGARLAELFIDAGAVRLFRLSADRIECVEVLGADHAADVRRLVGLLDDDADDAWDRLLENAAYRRLIDAIDDTGAGGRLYVVPHGPLHRAPLYLDSTGVPRSGTVLLPSASLLRTARTPRGGRTGGLPIVAGDPTLDLPFARVECEIVGQRLGAVPRAGAEVTLDWLAGSLATDPRPRLVHLACHGYFDEHRAQRSGLLLAGADGGRLATLAELADLDWSGVLAVLSACESGQHVVRWDDELAGLSQTLLAAGAVATLTTLRPVPDVSTALLMTWFYEELEPGAGWGLEQVCGALAGAQRRMRSSTGTELLRWAGDAAAQGPAAMLLAAKVVAAVHRAAGRTDRYVAWEARAGELREGRGGLDPEAFRAEVATGTGSGYSVRPYAAPRHWAAFGVHGAGWVS